ncbi:MAG: hypothetical protein ACRDJE_29245 [Dehalococcoidia bacterium]
MNTTNRSHNRDRIAELFGASAERDAFEQTARERADEPQTAPFIIITVALTIYYKC